MKNINNTIDFSSGNLIFMPAHPDADENGYVDVSRPGFITDLVNLILTAKKDFYNSAVQKLYQIPINKV